MLKATTQSDIPIIERWIRLDAWHSSEARNSAEWLLTGYGLLSFQLFDSKGPVCFIRLDADDDKTRAAIQFGPEEEVSKRRLVVGLMRAAFPAIVKFSKDNGFKGVIFESVNPSLISFLEKHQGVRKAAGENDYALIFGEENDV